MSTTWDHSLNESPLWGLPRHIDGLWRWESRAFNPHAAMAPVLAVDVLPGDDSGPLMWWAHHLDGAQTRGCPESFESLCHTLGLLGVRPRFGEWHYFGPAATREANPWAWPRPVVYFTRPEEDRTGAIKIGYSAELGRRIWELQPTTAQRLEVLLWLDGSRAREAELHRAFAEERMQGEWFRASDRLLNFIDENRGFCSARTQP